MDAGHDDRKALGALGEDLVRRRLQGSGYRVLAANFRCAQGEIDLIAEETVDGTPTLVFLEVKTRRGRRHGTPIEAIDERKRRRLIATAQAYLAERNLGGDEPACRFDVAEVFIDSEGRARIDLRHGVLEA